MQIYHEVIELFSLFSKSYIRFTYLRDVIQIMVGDQKGVFEIYLFSAKDKLLQSDLESLGSSVFKGLHLKILHRFAHHRAAIPTFF